MKKQFGVVYSPEYSFRVLKAGNDEKALFDLRDSLEIPKFGYSAGFNFSYQITNKCMFEIGLLFSDKGERTKKHDLKNTVFIAEQDKIPATSNFVNHYYYLDIPLKFNYYLIQKKINFFLTAGISVNSFLYQKTLTTIENKDGSSKVYNTVSHPKFEKINFALIAGFGINYNLTDRHVLKLEPLYKRSITPIANAPIKSYLYSLGLNFGITCRF
jgi:opacity protein-like surface antigen